MKKYTVSALVKCTEVHFADNEEEAIESFKYEHEDDEIYSIIIVEEEEWKK